MIDKRKLGNPYGVVFFHGLRSLWCKFFHGTDYEIVRPVAYCGEYVVRCRKCELLKCVRR